MTARSRAQRTPYPRLGAVAFGVVILSRIGSAAAAPTVQSAAPPPSPPPEHRLSNEGRAEQLFHAAEKKFDSGDYEGSCLDFSASLKLGPKLGTLLNLALCHETIGKVVT